MRIRTRPTKDVLVVKSSKLLALQLILLAQTVVLIYTVMNKRPTWEDVWKQHLAGYEMAINECVTKFTKEDQHALAIGN